MAASRVTPCEIPFVFLKDHLISATNMASAMIRSIAGFPWATGRFSRKPSAFKSFMDLPPELRDMVYEYYFLGAVITPVSKPQPPRTKNCTAILEVNKQVSYESRKVMRRDAVFTINMHPEYAVAKEIDLPYLLNHEAIPGVHFSGPYDVFSEFRNFDIHLTMDPDRSSDFWQRSVPVVASTISILSYLRSSDFTASINLGNLNIGDIRSKLLRHYAKRDSRITFDRAVAAKPHKTTDEESHDIVRSFRDRAGWYRESYALRALIFILGQWSVDTGSQLRIENEDRNVQRIIHANNVLGILNAAAGLDDGRSVWLVVEKGWRTGKRHRDAVTALAKVPVPVDLSMRPSLSLPDRRYGTF